MTEPELYLAYSQHVRTCGGCATSANPAAGWSTARCQAGMTLFERWRQAAAQQDQGTQPIRRERAGSRR